MLIEEPYFFFFLIGFFMSSRNIRCVGGSSQGLGNTDGAIGRPWVDR